MKQETIFYKTGVDISSIKQMYNFIKGHFTYYTLNSWNGVYSIANNVKVYNLHLDGNWSTALALLFDEGDDYGIQDTLATMIYNWENKHPGYCVYFNGRSDGYLVLGNEKNIRGVLPESIRDTRNYEEFKQYVYTYYKTPVEDMFWDLRNLVVLIRDFDRLCDNMREALNFAVMQKEDYDERRTLDE